EIVAHYAACAGLGVPVVAYNAPRYSNPITPSVFDALLDMEHVVGVKDSSGDLELLRDMVTAARTRRPDFGVGQGAEGALVAGLRAGADGIVPGVANIAPDVAVALYRAWCAERSLEIGTPTQSNVHSAHHARAASAPSQELRQAGGDVNGSTAQGTPRTAGDGLSPEHWQGIVDELCGIHRIRPGVPIVKAILDDRGLCPPHVAPPLLPCTASERAAVLELLAPHEAHLIM
ncbi:dihydrodipicolinate synthase family protein, partial [Phytoactinopolyspora endophytica]|uniref:dihydrodipicolinate synthase family protein n=1 Tax=Phytoactinopolyspora endophytica TaxID=1642495 RepID=UPI00197BCCE2